MKLSAPKKVTWWFAVVIGVFGILAYHGIVGFWNGTYAFWMVAAGFILLVLGTLFKDL